MLPAAHTRATLAPCHKPLIFCGRTLPRARTNPISLLPLQLHRWERISYYPTAIQKSYISVGTAPWPSKHTGPTKGVGRRLCSRIYPSVQLMLPTATPSKRQCCAFICSLICFSVCCALVSNDQATRQHYHTERSNITKPLQTPQVSALF